MPGQSDGAPLRDAGGAPRFDDRSGVKRASAPEANRTSRSESNPRNWSARQSLTAVFRNSGRTPTDIDAIREVVYAYVDAERRHGARVESVIVDLKQAMRAAGVVDTYTDPDERALAEAVVRWGIERYYGPWDGRYHRVNAPTHAPTG